MADSIVVLGGGVIGLSCAFEAARRGMKVTLIEPGTTGGQASGAAAGMLAPYSENTEQPDAFFQFCLRSLRLYPDWIRDIEELSGMSAEWVRSGSLNVFMHEADVLPVETRMRWQNEWSARAELVGAAELRKLEPKLTASAVAGLYTPSESHVYAPKLVEALEAACRKLGVSVVEQAGALLDASVNPGGGATVRFSRLDGPVHAERLVVCAGAWSGEYGRWFGLSVPIHPIRGQICSFGHAAGEVRHMVFSSQAYWVGKRNDRLVCGASEDVAGFETSVTERGIGRLVRSSGRMFPHLAGKETLHRWAGLRPATRDGLPLLGEIAGTPSVIMAAGHYRNGILLSPATAFIVADLLEGKRVEPALAAFAPDRFTPAAKIGLGH
ncbi:glycine oxidase ThiO [Paenibacillus arenilitoris]|uniref:glycine oxidase n=1 Tax=Paenibacillus arenilitoris TaxID=2772299 RepID=A0A927CRR8_9BACL|nr:glycine oxidase ThiO [Paenibacillus arenilitoris]MBD2872559.1 glycine oxidase ThiO [Paenibacillus arenilitoris]